MRIEEGDGRLLHEGEPIAAVRYWIKTWRPPMSGRDLREVRLGGLDRKTESQLLTRDHLELETEDGRRVGIAVTGVGSYRLSGEPR